MAKNRLYNLNYTTYYSISEEIYSDVGSDTFQLGTVKRGFIEDGFSIVTADSNETELIEDVDFEFAERDTYYSDDERAGVDVWTGITILNSEYQTGNLSITYQTIGSYTDAEFMQGANPPGVVLPYMATGDAPYGYLLCDGTAYSRTTYRNLFNTIGTTYGIGDGSTTFNVPDLRGQFLRGYEAGTTEALGTKQECQMQEHIHLNGIGETNPAIYLYDEVTEDVPGGATATMQLDASTPSYQGETSVAKNDGTHGIPRTGYETRPRNHAVQWIIKY